MMIIYHFKKFSYLHGFSSILIISNVECLWGCWAELIVLSTEHLWTLENKDDLHVC